MTPPDNKQMPDVILKCPENPTSEAFGEQPFIDARYDGDNNIWLRIGVQSFKLASLDPERIDYPDRGDGWMMRQVKKAIDNLTTYMITGGKNLSTPSVTATYLVIVCAEEEYYGVFSTEEKASEWASKQEPPCVICPYVIDEPDFGNVENG